MIEEIRKIAKKIRGKRIVVQLPEGLRTRIPEIREILLSEGKEPVFDLDPFYGACDIRLNEARAVGADAVLHIGHLPMVKHKAVYYVEWSREADVEAIKRAVASLARSRKVCVATTANFRWIIPELEGIGNVVVGEGSWRVPYRGVVLGCDTSACNVSADVNVFVGDGHFHPLAIWVNTGRPTYRVDPGGGVEEVRYEGVLRKRLALLGSLSGRQVGIVVSSKIGQNRLPLAEQLSDIAREHGYEPYLLVSDYFYPDYVMGLGLDFVVFTGCPRVAIDDGDRFPVPVITPEEFLYKLGLLKDYRVGWITRVPPRGNEG